MANVTITFTAEDDILSCYNEPQFILKQCSDFIESSYRRGNPYNARSLVDSIGRCIGEIEVVL